MTAITPKQLWVGLFLVAALAFAGCALGAVPCSVFKPLGLAAALGAGFVSLFDSDAPVREEVATRE